MPAIDFWYELGSTYSYPAAMRIEPIAKDAGVALRWRPFALGAIFVAQGWPADSPFNWQAAKGSHMWRDMERICQAAGLPFRRPDPFPQASLHAARIALIAHDEGWGADFARAVYLAEFGAGRQIGDFEVLADIISALDRVPNDVISRSRREENKARLKAETDAAQQMGIFGAPTFLTGDGELFWGNDRLEQAVYWARHGSLRGYPDGPADPCDAEKRPA